MKALGPCCTWNDFWDGFKRQWGRRHRAPTEIPPYIERKARRFWRVYAMTGFEACETVMQDIAREAMAWAPLDPKAEPEPKIKPVRNR